MESCGEMEIAKNFYQSSKDYLSLARIYCYTEQVDKVIALMIINCSTLQCFDTVSSATGGASPAEL